MDRIASLTQDNIHFLEQGRALLLRLSDEEFVTRPPIDMSPVADHLRHCLDFYACFLDGQDVGVIDYDARRRDPRLEKDRGYALAAIETLIERLDQAAEGREDRSVSVATDRSEWETGDLAWAASTLARELQFLRSHTVHHYALIAAVLKMIGIEPAVDFGVAPSTLAFRKETANHHS